MQNLPLELKIEILLFLEERDLNHMLILNKTWAQVSKSERFWQLYSMARFSSEEFIHQPRSHIRTWYDYHMRLNKYYKCFLDSIIEKGYLDVLQFLIPWLNIFPTQ